MSPTAPEPKKKKVLTIPSFIDDKLIATLSELKQAYWSNRKLGKRGIMVTKPKAKVVLTPKDIAIGFDNEGRMVAKTRAVRRRKLPTDNQYTKKQNKRKK